MNTVRIVCTDKGTHPSRELAYVRHYGEDLEWLKVLRSEEPLQDLLGMDLPPLSDREAQWVHDIERVMPHGRLARRGGYVDTSRVEFGFTNPDVEYIGVAWLDSEPDRRGQLWRFQCPTCKRDTPMRDATVRRLVEGILAAGRVVVDLSRLPANLA